MFPCFSNNGNDPIISYNDQEAYNRPFYIDTIISDSKQQELPPLSFTHFPSPYELELEDFYHNVSLQQNFDVLLHELQPLRATGSTNLSQSGLNMLVSNKDDVVDQLTEISNKKSDNSAEPIIPTKRPSKKDRHSKINTAQGPRDRRMRLSLKVARGFFDLQDKLGFDKASKTVEWLLTQAKDEIKKLTSTFPQMNSSSSVATKSASSTSEGEVLSKFNIEGSISKGKHSPCARKERKTSKPQPRKTTFAPLAKESREKARAKARERTREKWIRSIQGCKLSEQNHNLNQSGYWTSRTFEIGEVSRSHTHDMNPSSLDALAEVEEQLDTTEGMIDENLEVMGSWSPSFSNHLNNPAIPQEMNQFTDFQAWYYNINGMC